MEPLVNFKDALAVRLLQAQSDPNIPDHATAALISLLREDCQNIAGTSSPNSLDQTFNHACNTAEKKFDTACDLTLVNSLREMAPRMDWFKRPSEPDSAFQKGHSNAEIIGRRGLEVRDGITVGLTVMEPGVIYPDHHHPPEEVYVVLSPGQWRQNADPWWEPGFGGYVYNPPNILHAMRSDNDPLLAIWCLNY